MIQSKTPLVLLPGLLSNEALWEHQIDHLADLVTTCVIPSTQDTPQKMVQAILDNAPSKFALAGHSMGGWLCLEVFRAAPDRITKLCLLNTTARIDPEGKKRRRQEMVRQTEKGEFQQVVKGLVENLVFNPLMKSSVEKMFLAAGEETFINQERAMLTRGECESVLSTIDCPTLIIHAMQDRLFSLGEHKELAKQIPQGKVAIIEDSGHMSPMEMPQAVSALLRFWLTYF